jgi:hypothetical protein
VSKRGNAKAINEAFVPHMLSMLISPAWMALSLTARRVLDRIEIEHMQHGGKENGNLIITYSQFVEYGIDRHAIGPAVREVEALGFVEITERGRAGNREYRRPHKYRLTYREAKGAMGNGTHEWRGVRTPEEAKALAEAARSSSDRNNISVIRQQRKRTKQRPGGAKAGDGRETDLQWGKTPSLGGGKPH